jgi:DMSO/TMAO reductase YedYZ molybdopterin-dependent catalytic subunit
MRNIRFLRRQFLALGAAGLGGTLLTGCDRLSESSDVQEGLSSAEWLTYRVQRLLGGQHALAREFTASDVSPVFKVNGSHMPEGEEYAALLESNFADWRLRVDGLVANPLELSLADLRNLPQRTQITRHDCVEGWSAIGKWPLPRDLEVCRSCVVTGWSSRSFATSLGSYASAYNCARSVDARSASQFCERMLESSSSPSAK